MTSVPPDIAIVFGMLSCRSSAAAIRQFARAVAPHRVLVHHDFSQTPELFTDHDNIIVLSKPEKTAWGSWSLVRATFRLIEHAMTLDQWDYFQLVSEACLPARPVQDFEAALQSGRPDVMIDMQPLIADNPAAVMNYGWRYLPRSRCLTRIARRAGLWWIGRQYAVHTVCGGHVRIPHAETPGLAEHGRRIAGRLISEAFLASCAGAFPVGGVRQCWVGSQWFCVARSAAERLLELRRCTPALEAHFQRCHIPDESYIHTLVAHCGFKNVVGGTHVTFWDARNCGPDQVAIADFARVVDSGRFFARKFSLDPNAPARLEMLDSLNARLPVAQHAAAPYQLSSA
jgi:hypothetical protein